MARGKPLHLLGIGAAAGAEGRQIEQLSTSATEEQADAQQRESSPSPVKRPLRRWQDSPPYARGRANSTSRPAGRQQPDRITRPQAISGKPTLTIFGPTQGRAAGSVTGGLSWTATELGRRAWQAARAERACGRHGRLEVPRALEPHRALLTWPCWRSRSRYLHSENGGR